MSGIREDGICFPCHIYGVAEAAEAGRDLEVEPVKDFCAGKFAVDTDKLHRRLNVFYVAPVAERKLVRCRKCGALMIIQSICDTNIYDGFEYLEDWIPVCSEEEADRLNGRLDAVDLSAYPARHLRRRDLKAYEWTDGEEPGSKNVVTEGAEGA